MNKNLKKICVSPKNTLKETMDLMNSNKPEITLLPPGIILVVNKNQKLLGILTDGDIRRALAREIKVEDLVERAMNKNPFFIETENLKSSTDTLLLISEQIRKGQWRKKYFERIIVVDKKRRVKDLLSLPDLLRSGDVRFKHIGIFGLGYVGLTLGLTLADLGFEVKGFDSDPQVVKAVKKGRPHFFEMGLESLFKDHSGKNFKVTDNFQGENACDIYFITVGTPLKKNKRPDLNHLGQCARALGKVLKRGDAVIVRSTVPVGVTRNFIIPLLEKHSGLKAGSDFLVSFAPERTVEGQALEELRKLPQVIGGFNRASADLTTSIFSFMTDSIFLVDSLEEAEIVKLINNTYRDVIFSFANEVSLICQKWEINTHRVIEAANAGYERSNVPHPGPGVGGYCLEKDPFIFIESAERKSYSPLLAPNAREISTRILDSIAKSIFDFLKKSKKTKKSKIFVLGLAFKGQPLTSDTRGSTSLLLARKLQKKGYQNIWGFDPLVAREAAAKNKIKYVTDLKKGFDRADAILIMNNNPDFEKIEMRHYLNFSRPPILFFDAWHLFQREEIEKAQGVIYKTL